MRKNLVNTVFFVLILMMVPTGLMGQSMVTSVGVDKDNIDLRGSVQVLDSLTVTVSETGKALLRFDGYCIASPGDKIYLAVSKTKMWGACDDNVNIEVPDNDVNSAPFVHTRVFELTAGTHTFYAVAHNHIEMSGTGIATIHGNLLMEFFSDEDEEMITFKEIAAENRYVRGLPFLFASTTLSLPEPGKIQVSFEGLCLSSVGDLISLAASEEMNWAAFNDGVIVEAYNSDINGHSFSHSKVYDVGAGSHTFYAVAENFHEFDGNGRISVYGILTAIYYPDKIKTDLVNNQVIQNSIDVRNNDFVVSEINLNSLNGGTVLARYNGMANISPGDRIDFAISNSATMPSGNSNIRLESLNADKPFRSFSNTKLFDIAPGEHTFYVMARNQSETDGSGLISTYGNFSVVFEGTEVISSTQEASLEHTLIIAPNPAIDHIYISFEASANVKYSFQLIDINGRVLAENNLAYGTQYELDVSSYAPGMYFVRITGNNITGTKALIIQ